MNRADLQLGNGETGVGYGDAVGTKCPDCMT